MAHRPGTLKCKPDLKCKPILDDLTPCNCTVPGGSAVTMLLPRSTNRNFPTRRVYGRVPGPLSPRHP